MLLPRLKSFWSSNQALGFDYYGQSKWQTDSIFEKPFWVGIFERVLLLRKQKEADEQRMFELKQQKKRIKEQTIQKRRSSFLMLYYYLL